MEMNKDKKKKKERKILPRIKGNRCNVDVQNMKNEYVKPLKIKIEVCQEKNV